MAIFFKMSSYSNKTCGEKSLDNALVVHLCELAIYLSP